MVTTCKITWLIHKVLLLMLVSIASISCTRETKTVSGLITKIEQEHIGRNNYITIITYSYSYDGKRYSSKEDKWIPSEANYLEGDSIRVKLIVNQPEKSSIIGPLHQVENVQVIKLESKK